MTESEEAALIRTLYGAYTDNADKPWSVTLLPGDQIRYEVRPGDVWDIDAGLGKERSELSQAGRVWSLGTPIEINYRMMLEPGAPNTADWVVLAQLHTAQWNLPGVASPPFSVVLQGDGLAISIRNIPEPSPDKPTPPTVLWVAPSDIVRGAWYDIKVHILPDATKGGGFLDVWINGVQVVDYTGPIGYGSDTVGYFWKQGIYRAASDETLVMHVDDLTVYGEKTTFAATAGDDSFTVDNPGDEITGSLAGIDEIRTALLSFSLPLGVENLTFIGGGQAHFNGTGNALNNRITGAARGDTLSGGTGDDTLLGLDADDHLYGGSGNDSLDGGGGLDAVYGGTGDDRLIGGSAADSLYGGDGNDWLDEGANPGLLDGGAGDDVYVYWGDLPTIVETADGGIDTIRTERFVALLPDFIERLVMTGSGGSASGNVLDNLMTGSAGDNNIQGLDGNDTLLGEAGADRLSGDAGNDLLQGGDGNDTLRGGDGADRLIGGQGADSLVGGAGIDTAAYDGIDTALVVQLNASGTGTADSVSTGTDSLAEIEVIRGGLGADAMTGTATGLWADIFLGMSGADTLSGGGGNDTLFGGIGADALYGGAGDDLLNGGATGDLIDGGTGIDTVVFSGPVAARVDLLLTTVQNTRHGPDLIVNVENVTGGAQSDRLRGNDLDNVLTGGAGNDSLMGHLGNDRLIGGAGRDQLSGGDGADSLNGGAGNDLLSGGSGADVFLFTSSSGADRITDFDLAVDSIRFLSGVASMSGLTFSAAGNDLVITWQNGSVSLAGLATETLTADHFAFG